jgi:hypothetical protein
VSIATLSYDIKLTGLLKKIQNLSGLREEIKQAKALRLKNKKSIIQK